MLTNVFYVFVGGGVGSLLRFAVSLLMMNLTKSVFPLATLISNFLSCLTVGLVVFLWNERLVGEAPLRLLIITGFCGGFSTFSAFSYETIELVRSGYMGYAILNILISLSLGLGVVYFFTRTHA